MYQNEKYAKASTPHRSNETRAPGPDSKEAYDYDDDDAVDDDAKNIRGRVSATHRNRRVALLIQSVAISGVTHPALWRIMLEYLYTVLW